MTARLLTAALLLLVALVPLAAFGCSRPNQANIELRKEKQTLEDRITQLGRENQQLRSQIRALESDRPTVETLPQERLEALFTTAGIRLGRLTRRAREFEGLKVYVQPFDGEGDALKAAGSLRVEAFDLSAGDDAHVGEWAFSLSEATQLWRSGSLVSGFVLDCPWEATGATRPADDRPLLVRVEFVDALTGRTFEARRDVE